MRSGSRDEEGGVNEYGTAAMEHWRRWRPRGYSAIVHPEGYFAMVGQRAQREVEQRVAHRMADALFSDHPSRRFIQRAEIIERVKAEVENEFCLLPPEPHLAREYELFLRRRYAAEALHDLHGVREQPEAG